MVTAITRNSAAVVIISNGPGELATWVKPVVNYLTKSELNSIEIAPFNLKLVLALVPCPNATGKEFKVAKKWKKFDLIIPAKNFFKLLFNPSLFGEWPKNGVVVFLGGDQFWNILLAKRLGYKSITYAEWIARWPRWNAHIAAMNAEVKNRLPRKYHTKCQIIGDLMADITNDLYLVDEINNYKWIALLPGSKKVKLSVGIPFFLEVADSLNDSNENINLMIPIAPTAELKDFIYFQSDQNPIAKYYSSKIKSLQKIDNPIFEYVIETKKNTKIFILNQTSNHNILSQCKLAITTVGANTSELAAINLPMIVILPTQHLNVMNAWDGIFGILSKITLINRFQSYLVKKWYINNKKFFAWPNIKANKLIIPERIGYIFPKEISNEALFLLKNSNLLNEQKINLLKLKGKTGAVKKLINLIINSLTKD
tara:strand:+ start:372 stop:1649 length:1278 start_codon:yes stop_codon:yes gene_type:complete